MSARAFRPHEFLIFDWQAPAALAGFNMFALNA
jgi:hypothetical protein